MDQSAISIPWFHDASQVLRVKGEKATKLRTMRQIQQSARNLLDPPPNMEPVQHVTAVFAKPADDSTHSVFAVRQQGEFCLGTTAIPSENGLDFLLRLRVEVPDNRSVASLPLHSADKDFQGPSAGLFRLCLHEAAVDPHREMFGRLGNRRRAVYFAD